MQLLLRVRFPLSSLLLLSSLWCSVIQAASLPPSRSEVIHANLEAIPLHRSGEVQRAWVIHEKLPWASNSLLVEMSQKEFILVDTPTAYDPSIALLLWINQKFDFPNLRVINTHFHLDSAGGNQVFLNAGFTVMGSILTHTLIRGLPEKPGLAPPNRTFFRKQGLTLTLQNETVELFHPGHGHSPDFVAVYFPKRRLLFGGCMLKDTHAQTLGNLADANLDEWPQAVDALKKRGAKQIITGHGKGWGVKTFQKTIQLIAQAKKNQKTDQ